MRVHMMGGSALPKPVQHGGAAHAVRAERRGEAPEHEEYVGGKLGPRGSTWSQLTKVCMTHMLPDCRGMCHVASMW